MGAYDASTAICLPDGQLVAMGPYITTQAHVVRGIVEMEEAHEMAYAAAYSLAKSAYRLG